MQVQQPLRKNLIRGAICLASCLVVLIFEIFRPSPISRLDEVIRDGLLRIQASSAPVTGITIVDIDDTSLADIGPWPWPRGVVADLIEILLNHYQAQSIGLDIVFPESGDPDGDARLTLLARAAPVAFAQIFDYTPRQPAILSGQPGGGMAANTGHPAQLAYGHIANHPQLAEQARCIGNIGYTPDADGILRHLAMTTRFAERDYPNFAQVMVDCVRPKSHRRTTIPAQERWRIPYRHTESAFTVISATDILARQAPHNLLANRLVLIGSSSIGINDQVATPLSSLTAGVMVHAESISALLEETPLNPFSRATIVGITLASLLLAAIGIIRLHALGSITLLIALAFSWLLLAAWQIREQAEFSVAAPLTGYLLLLTIAAPYEWAESQRRARRLIQTFSHYVSQPVLDEILRRDLAFSLTPQLREITVLIADMENYTKLTATLPLDQAAQLTKDFLDCLTRPVLEHGGTLDKYSGDGLVAFWGAPLECPDQADRAVRAALEIQEKVAKLDADSPFSDTLAIRVRIGIESGTALVGDLGTDFRSTYTAVGDCINFASRLETAAKGMPVCLLVGELAKNKLRRFSAEHLGSLAVRGTQKSIEIYTVRREQEANEATL